MKQAKIEVRILLFLIIVGITSASVLSLVRFGILTPKSGGDVNLLNAEFIPFGREGYLVVKDFKFCEFVDEKFRCIGAKDHFRVGDKMYVVFLVQSSTSNSQIMMVRNYQIKDAQGTVKLELDQKNNYQLDVNSKKDAEIVAFADYFTLSEDYKSGRYTLDIIVDNPLLNKKITLKKEFVVE